MGTSDMKKPAMLIVHFKLFKNKQQIIDIDDILDEVERVKKERKFSKENMFREALNLVKFNTIMARQELKL